MKIATRTMVAGATSALALLLWPIAKHMIADFQLQRVDVFEARLVQYGRTPFPQTFGPTRLNSEQRARLLDSLEWDYVLMGKSFSGWPSGIISEKLEISGVGEARGVEIDLVPYYETNSFQGWVAVGGWNRGARRGWEGLKSELFPESVGVK